jgi:hypothetical protein
MSDNRRTDRKVRTIREAVQETGLSASTVRRYLASGRLPKIQLGGPGCAILIPAEALAGLLPSNHNTPNEGDGTASVAQDQTNQADISQRRSHGPQPKWKERRPNE